MYHSDVEIKDALTNKKGHPFDGHDYEVGELEGIAGTAERVSDTVWKLLIVLVAKKLLTEDEAVAIAYEYGKV